MKRADIFGSTRRGRPERRLSYRTAIFPDMQSRLFCKRWSPWAGTLGITYNSMCAWLRAVLICESMRRNIRTGPPAQRAALEGPVNSFCSLATLPRFGAFPVLPTSYCGLPALAFHLLLARTLLFLRCIRTPGASASSMNSMPSASSAPLMAANPLTIAVPDISAPVSIRSTV